MSTKTFFIDVEIDLLTHQQPWFCKQFVEYFNILSKSPFPKVQVCANLLHVVTACDPADLDLDPADPP